MVKVGHPSLDQLIHVDRCGGINHFKINVSLEPKASERACKASVVYV